MHRHGAPRGKCGACLHAERMRLDYLLSTGSTAAACARKFGLSADTVERHKKRHITDQYKASVRIGPFASESELRKLVAENSSSVVQNLQSIYSGLAARWLSCFESGADLMLVQLTKAMHHNLDMRARISRELAPPSTIVANFYNSPVMLELQKELLRVLAQHPQARRDVIEALRELERKAPPLIEVKADDRAA